MEEKIGHGFKLLISCPSGLSHSQVSVVFDEAYDPTLELSISEIWDARVQQSSSLYNGTKFRYSGYNFDVGNNSKQQPHVSLHLGLTDYRFFSIFLLLPSINISFKCMFFHLMCM
ncbi:hypothetical protein P3L10_030026 [Capsicum annuum]